ncbi:hypothetical protein QAD02_011943 [Eretmocerus hayati]|uniref:Uncharacterized protein n=1 Tax=Eretmocerus hayati TaxID=131215 RepID=A0ACC2NYG6_9HYME|nr:hypothetical protein QAD02_011943 [Eretmocerus hayati]
MNSDPKSPPIKSEPKDTKVSRRKNSSARGQNSKPSTVSTIDPSKITPEQLKKVSNSRIVPKIISNVVVPSHMETRHKDNQIEDIIHERHSFPIQNAQSLMLQDEIVKIYEDSSSANIPQDPDLNIEPKLSSLPNVNDSAEDAQNNNSNISADILYASRHGESS